MKIRIVMEWELLEDGELPRFADQRDVYYLMWCDSGLPMLIRRLFTIIPDGHSLRGDRIPHHADYRFSPYLPRM